MIIKADHPDQSYDYTFSCASPKQYGNTNISYLDEIDNIHSLITPIHPIGKYCYDNKEPSFVKCKPLVDQQQPKCPDETQYYNSYAECNVAYDTNDKAHIWKCQKTGNTQQIVPDTNKPTTPPGAFATYQLALDSGCIPIDPTKTQYSTAPEEWKGWDYMSTTPLTCLIDPKSNKKNFYKPLMKEGKYCIDKDCTNPQEAAYFTTPESLSELQIDYNIPVPTCIPLFPDLTTGLMPLTTPKYTYDKTNHTFGPGTLNYIGNELSAGNVANVSGDVWHTLPRKYVAESGDGNVNIQRIYHGFWDTNYDTTGRTKYWLYKSSIL